MAHSYSQVAVTTEHVEAGGVQDVLYQGDMGELMLRRFPQLTRKKEV